MKSVGWYITKLLIVSLIISLIVTFFWGLYIWIWDAHWGVFMIGLLVPVIIQFILSLLAYINIYKKYRDRSLFILSSFLLPQLLLILYYAYSFWRVILSNDFNEFLEEGVEWPYSPLIMLVAVFLLAVLPYTLCMIVSYILFRKFCRRELGE